MNGIDVGQVGAGGHTAQADIAANRNTLAGDGIATSGIPAGARPKLVVVAAVAIEKRIDGSVVGHTQGYRKAVGAEVTQCVIAGAERVTTGTGFEGEFLQCNPYCQITAAYFQCAQAGIVTNVRYGWIFHKSLMEKVKNIVCAALCRAMPSDITRQLRCLQANNDGISDFDQRPDSFKKNLLLQTGSSAVDLSFGNLAAAGKAKGNSIVCRQYFGPGG